MQDRDLVNKIVKSVIWDYNIDAYEYFMIASGKNKKLCSFISTSIIKKPAGGGL